jgi:hypothetical protein
MLWTAHCFVIRRFQIGISQEMESYWEGGSVTSSCTDSNQYFVYAATRWTALQWTTYRILQLLHTVDWGMILRKRK